MAKHLVLCRVCKERFDINDPANEWVKPKTNLYYHKKCYEVWVSGKADIHKTTSDEEWFVYLKDYLANDVRATLNFAKLTKQWKSFLKKDFTAKGIYFAMRYFFEVQKADPTKTDGIGIIPYIYKDAAAYWVQRERHETGICAQIEAQLKERNEQETVRINIARTPKKKKTGKYDFSQLEGLDDF